MDIDLVVPHTEDIANVMISSTSTKSAAEASWGFRDFLLMYEAKPECILLYSECDYKGD